MSEEEGGGAGAGVVEEEDEDVLWEGSPLYKHLEKEGVLEGDGNDGGLVAAATARVRTDTPEMSRRRKKERSPRHPPPATKKGLCAQWPQHRLAASQLEVEVARRVLDSELLVQEDEDFVANFILTEEAIEMAKKSQEVKY